MKFIFLKLVEPLLMPVPLFFFGLLAGILLLWRGKRRAGLGLTALAAIFLYLFSIDPVACLLARGLDGRYLHAAVPAAAGLDAIVVLAGGAHRGGGILPPAELASATWPRFWRGVELYRELSGKVPIVYSGGSGKLFEPEVFEASLAREYALSLGIPEGDFLIEDASRNTYENARQTARLLSVQVRGRAPRVLLVTSSIHLRRALLAFSGAGIEVFPAPVDIQFRNYRFGFDSFVPGVGALALSTRCLHEWLGIIGYRLLSWA